MVAHTGVLPVGRFLGQSTKRLQKENDAETATDTGIDVGEG